MSKWYLVKLELGPTEEFPNGSPARAFLLRLPLGRDGSVDEPLRAATPRGAFVRRFWENEPDRSGAVARNPGGWNFVFPGEAADRHQHLCESSVRPGRMMRLTDSDGASMPFRVVSIRPG